MQFLNQIIKKYRNFEYIGSGNSADCYGVDNKSVLLVKNIDEEGYKRKVKVIESLSPKIEKLKKEGVNVCETKGIKYNQGIMYVLQERAIGKTLYRKSYDRLRNYKENRGLATEELRKRFDEEILKSQQLVKNANSGQIEKYISDYLMMVDEGIFWDSTFENLIYDKQNGFSFVDIDDGRKYTRDELMNNETYIYGDILKPLIGNVEGRVISDGLKQSTREVLGKVISVMKNFEREDIKFSKDVLNRVIELINEKFYFRLNRVEKESKAKEER